MDAEDTAAGAMEQEDGGSCSRKRALPTAFDDKMVEGERLKGLGNAAFKEKKYKKALKLYARVLAYTWVPSGEAEMWAGSRCEKPTPAQLQSMREVKCATLGNIAEVHLALGSPKEAMDACRKILDDKSLQEEESGAPLTPMIKAAFVKALVRTAKAHLALKDLVSAKVELQRAIAFDPASAGARELWRVVQQAFKEHRAEEKKKFGSLFAPKAA